MTGSQADSFFTYFNKYRKGNNQTRKWNYFSHFWASDQKTYFHDILCFTMEFKIDFQTGNGIIPPTPRPVTKKLLLKNVSHFHKGAQH